MAPVVVSTGTQRFTMATGQKRATTATDGLKEWDRGQRVTFHRVYNGYPLQTRSVAILLPFMDFSRMEHLWLRGTFPLLGTTVDN